MWLAPRFHLTYFKGQKCWRHLYQATVSVTGTASATNSSENTTEHSHVK
jgi:hypothetical protein